MSDDAVTTGAAPDETISMRADERLDPAVVAAYLRGRVPGSDRPLQIRQFGGGFANLTYLLRFGDDDGDAFEYVLRRPPLGPVPKGAHDMKREYRTLSQLWRAFPQAARAHLLCEDTEVIGAEFFVMDRLDGVVVRREVPERFGGGRDPARNRKLGEACIDTLAAFHEVDAKALGLDSLGKPEGFLERQVSGWSGRWEKARTSPLPIADEVSRWLDANRPASPPATLLHNDWKLDNMAVAPDDPGRCVAVYDWDMCTVGDPLCDVGTLMCSWLEAGEVAIGPAVMPSQVPGFLTRAEALDRYAAVRGIDLDAMPYYLVFGNFKMAVVLQQIYARYARGQTQDERFAGMESAAKVLFDRAGALRP